MTNKFKRRPPDPSSIAPHASFPDLTLPPNFDTLPQPTHDHGYAAHDDATLESVSTDHKAVSQPSPLEEHLMKKLDHTHNSEASSPSPHMPDDASVFDTRSFS